MEFQIDFKPESIKNPSLTSFTVDVWIDGQCFQLGASANTVKEFLNAGMIKQLKGKLRDASGSITEFEYPNKVDSAGVQYTSRVYEMTSK